ncbi:hypothetical protein EGY05_01340 [Chryseobacterium arthrosphaerae]|uniref:hypothetical protein n=1 Tax=Chryseobacterium arthrosphaerae TaxID=651561 RepID=UPI000F4F69CE|nr:hypothetical protein [Chryseobacterium arthrosphaerae]AYZ10679.1 hypothetical protein EGY05_01340 [Chryseobacterium arthrosphaerae]
MKINNPKYIKLYIDENFEFILSQIYECFKKMKKDYVSIENNENKIKNRLYKDYLDNQNIRNELGLNDFLFKTEIGFIDENYNEKGYSDIEIIDLKKSFYSTESSYIVECKRLDSKNPNNKSSLYNSYVKEGINRFIDEKYPTYYGVNGMLGFVVEPTNIKSQCSFFSDFTNYNFIEDYDLSFKSQHQTKSNKKITLYHLMLDFSDKVN